MRLHDLNLNRFQLGGPEKNLDRNLFLFFDL